MAIATLLGALNRGIGGLFASRMATNVINHNLANANTPGYSRQSILLSSARPIGTPNGFLGRGVQLDGVTRTTDAFVERQLMAQTSVLENYTAVEDSLVTVEQIMGSLEDDRVGDALSRFFDAFGDLATSPEDAGAKQAVVQQGENLSVLLRDIDLNLLELRRNVTAQMEAGVGRVNQLLRQVAALNQETVRLKSTGDTPNDLIDQRNLMILEIAELADVRIHDRGDGTVDVIMAGRSVVTRNTALQVRLETDTDQGGPSGARILLGDGDLEVPIDGGQLGGLLHTSNEILPSVQEQLDGMTRSLIDRVNTLHRQGTTAAGTGRDFFTGSSAATLAVSSDIAADPSRVATGTSGLPGDNTIADAIANLRDTAPSGESLSVNDQYVQMIVSIATENGSISSLRRGQETIVHGLTNRLEATRGVSIDEELALLMQYQRSFEASARVISAVDDMLDTLVNRMI